MSGSNDVYKKIALMILVVVVMAVLIYAGFHSYTTVEMEPSEHSVVTVSTANGGFGYTADARINDPHIGEIERIHLVDSQGKVIEKETVETGATAVTLSGASPGESYTAVAIDENGEIVERRSFEVEKHWPWEGGVL